MTRANEPIEAEPVSPGPDIPLGPAAHTPPPRDTYGPTRAQGGAAGGGGQAFGTGPQGPPPPRTLEYERREAMWEFWTRSWWTRPRNLMAAGMGLVGFGWGCTLTYWPGPPVMIAVGAFMIGLALPVRRDEP